MQNLQGGTLIVALSNNGDVFAAPDDRDVSPKVPRCSGTASRSLDPPHGVEALRNGQIDLAIVGGEIPTELVEALEIVPYAEDELASRSPLDLTRWYNKKLSKEDLYKLQFISLDPQSTIRKVIDQYLNLLRHLQCR